MKATQIRKGVVIMYNGEPHKVMDFFHNTPGKGQAVVQTKLRNLITGNQTEVRFASTKDVEEADVLTKSAVYLYNDDAGYHFMDNETYEQIAISKELLGDAIYCLQDNMEVDITLYEGNPIGVQLPQTVTLEIKETEPEVKGATVTSSYKPAVTTTGLQISVPPFIKEGDKIIINTDEMKYVGRADS